MGKIIILGWGSLIKIPGELSIKGNWIKDGPILNLEFSRVSKDGRLTLVIDEINGRPLTTLYAFSKQKKLDDAIENLRKREETILNWIGYIDTKEGISSKEINTNQVDVFDNVKKWAEGKGFDAVIWTALKTNFFEKTGKLFKIDHAIEYLRNLPKDAQKKAIDYFKNVPEQIKTELRDKVETEFNP